MASNVLEKMLGLSDKTSLESLENIDNTLQQLYATEKERAGIIEDQLKAEESLRKKLLQRERRKEADEPKVGTVKKMFGKEKDKKEGVNWLLVALGLGAAGAAIGSLINKEEIRDAIKKKLGDLVEAGLESAQEQLDKAIKDTKQK